jgi:hypothetical protein
MAWTLEDRLLLRCCGTRPRGALLRDANGTENRIDWDVFYDTAKKEGVASLVFPKLSEEFGDHGIPSRIVEKFSKDYYTVATRNTVMLAELGKVLTAFVHAGLPVIVLKGAALAETVYNNPALRTMSDVDLLIHPQDLHATDNILQKAGYRSISRSGIDIRNIPKEYLTTLDYRTASHHSLNVHLHWHFVNSTIPNSELINNISMADVWRDAQKAWIEGVETLIMAPHHLLIHLAEHSLRVTHSLSKFSYLCDIHATIMHYGASLKWDRLANDTRAWKLDRLVYYPLLYAAELLHSKMPSDFLARLRPERRGICDALFSYLVSRNNRFPGLSYLLHFSMQKGLARKTQFILRTLFPPRHVIAEQSGIPLKKVTLFFYLRRITRVILGGAKAIGRVAARNPR